MSQSQSQSQTRSGGVTATTRNLLDGLREEDRDTWNRFVRLYTPLVYHWCQKHNIKDDDIPDVVQEVFKAVANHIGNFHKVREQDTFRGWLRVITRSKAMDHHRRVDREKAQAQGGTVALRQLEEIPAPEAIAASDENGDDSVAQSFLFRQALELIRDEFHERTWKAFWQVVVNGRIPADVAEEMEMSPGAVRVAKCRVLQRLRLELGDLPTD